MPEPGAVGSGPGHATSPKRQGDDIGAIEPGSSPATFSDPDEIEERLDDRGTILAPDEERTQTPVLASGTELELGQVLGVGGMGTVRVARQPALFREVAVKTTTDPRLERALVLEAVVTGGLEHPNVVPVHALERAPDGVRLVMKRIRGVPWAELLARPEKATEAARGRDPLTFHVGVLVAVTDAVLNAHDQGVLHRDVKPANVMVGRFGEVWLLDWGIAVALWPDGRSIPLASNVRSIAGTPSYMSPEQARGDGAALGAASDVYLLGAALYEILAARPLRRGTVREQLAQAREGVVEPAPLESPWALRRLVQGALAIDPGQRPTAEEFRDGLVRWLDTRAAEPLVAEARVGHDALEQVDDADEPAFERAFAAVRATWTQALRIDPDHADARAGFERTLVLGARRALRRRDLVRAALLLDEVEDPPEELTRALEGVSREVAREQAELVRMRAVVADLDITRGRHERAIYGSMIGVTVGAACVGLGVVDRFVTPVGYSWILPALVVFDLGLGIGLVGWDRWWPLRPNRATRQLRHLIGALVLLITVHWTLSFVTGASVQQAIAGNALLSGSVLVAAGASVDPAFFRGGLFFVAAWVVAIVWPDVALIAFGVATGVSFGSYAANARVAGPRGPD